MSRFTKIIGLGLLLLFASPVNATQKKGAKKKKPEPVKIFKAAIPDPIDQTWSEMEYSYKLNKLLYLSDLYVQLCSNDIFDNPLDEKSEDSHYSELGVSRSKSATHLFPFPSTKHSALYFETKENDPNCILNIIVRPTQMEGAKNTLEEVVKGSIPMLDRNGNQIEMDLGLKRTVNAILYLLIGCEKEIQKASFEDETPEDSKSKKKK